MVLLETLSAEIMTLPLILMTFGQLSIIALVANLLIVPLVPLAMLFSAVAGTVGMLAPQIAGWFALPARLLLTYMLDIVHILSSIPSVLIHRAISTGYMIAVYSVVVGLIVINQHKYKKNKKPLETAHDLYLTP
jgi:competence protein ComEC